ncbi:MCE family protein [Aldersonia kunmingensis]|uniref:MCE family protein n=1 Tax=Aldersonia kunmingensis TaxID=408066 RepID=UPI0008327EE6|nr:MCE family protein [Aldersonia kunmingensis]
MKRTRLRVTSLALGGCVLASVATGCSGGIYSLPLPGGPDVGSDPMHIKMDFDDVLDLVPESAVKVNGVAVGRVTDIAIGGDGWTATVDTEVKNDIDLPANAVARIKQTNLLGEKYIDLAAPEADPSPEQLESGATIGIERTSHATEIEQVLGALSLLLNGGGVAQLQPIVVELNKALGGREPRVRSLLEQANTLIDGLNQEVDSITRALDGLDVLSTRVAEQTEEIAGVLDELPKGVQILEEQRPQFIGLLAQLDRLGEVGYDVVNTSKDDLITDLRALRPTLQALGAAAPDLVTAFPLIPTYPFPDSVLPAAIGGQVNTWLSVDLQIGTTLSNLGVGKPDPVYVPPVGPQPNINPANPYYNGNGPYPGWPTISLVPLPPIVPAGAPVPSPLDPLGSILEKLGGGGQ